MTAFACLGPSARPDAFGNYEPCPGYPCDACLKEETMESKINVAVGVPEGLPMPRVALTFEPATTAEFEEIIAAAGGAGEFVAAPGYAYANHPGFVIRVEEPQEVKTPPVSAFFEEFGERISEARRAREIVEQMT